MIVHAARMGGAEILGKCGLVVFELGRILHERHLWHGLD